MAHVIGVVAIGVVLAGMPAAGFLAVERAGHGHLGQLQQEAQFDGLQQVAVEALSLVVHGDLGVPLFERVDIGERLLECLLGAEHRSVVVHGLLQFAADVGHPFLAVLGEDVGDPVHNHAGRFGRHLHELVGQRVIRGGDAGPPAEDVDVQQRVGAQSVGSVHRHAGALPGGVQPRHRSCVVAQHLSGDGGGDATHHVVAGGVDRHQFFHRVDTEVGAGELGDVRQFRLQHVLAEVADVDVDVVLVRTGPATLQHLEHHGPRDDVARGQVDDCGGVAFHEPLALAVEQPAALAAHRLGDKNPEPGQSGRMELVELHVLQGKSLAEDDSQSVAGQGVGVGGGFIHPAGAAGGEHHRLGVEDVDVTGGQFVGHHPGGDRTAGGLGQ